MANINLVNIELREDGYKATFLLSDDGGDVPTNAMVAIDARAPRSRTLKDLSGSAWETISTQLTYWSEIAQHRLEPDGQMVSWNLPIRDQWSINVAGFQTTGEWTTTSFVAEPGNVSLVVVAPHPESGRDAAVTIRGAWTNLADRLERWRQEANIKRGDPKRHFNWTGGLLVRHDAAKQGGVST